MGVGGTEEHRLRLAVLGPVRLWVGDDEARLGPQQRALLALLAVRAGQPVLVDEIVDAVWGLRPPGSALNTVHRHVGTLRRAIEPELRRREQGTRVLRQGGGYLLVAAEHEVDLLRFRALVRQATLARAVGDTAAALDRSTAALRLWGGACAANLPPGSAGLPVFAAVDAELVAVMRAATDDALRARRPDEVIGLLRRTAGWEPLDESVHARLMLVLAAGGRQAEALRAYAAIRRRLADELGVDPGRELREAHQRVLRQDVGV